MLGRAVDAVHRISVTCAYNVANELTSLTYKQGTTTLGMLTYTYDLAGNVLTVTKLATRPNAVTTTLTYDPVYSQITTVTDPLSHTTTFGYDTKGNLTTITMRWARSDDYGQYTGPATHDQRSLE